MSELRARRQSILKRIADCCDEHNRKTSEVELVAISKTQDVASVLEAFSAGQTVFGENYVQEFKQKKLQITSKKIQWHFVGKVQTNKIKDLIGEVSLIHSIDRIKVAEILSGQCLAKGIVQSVLVELNVGHEASKNGFGVDEIKENFAALLTLSGIKIEGLMSFPPLVQDLKNQREFFRTTRVTRDKLQDMFKVELPRLSMGTTQDFESAIAEGSTLVRVGTALFGERVTK